MAKERKMDEKARFEILLEDLHGKIDMMLEGREITDNKIDRLEQKVDANKEELVAMMMSNSKALHEKIDVVDKKVDAIDNRLVKVEQKVDVLDKKIEVLSEQQQKMDKKIDKIDEKLTIRQNTIEKKVDNLVQEHLH